MNRVNRLKLPSILLLGLALAGCLDPSYDEAKNERTQIASESQDGDPIVVGVSWRSATEGDGFLRGVNLAVKEINQKGGVLDSPLEIIINDGESAYEDPNLSVAERQKAILDIANSFAANSNLVAVIGHSSSPIALLASVIYQNSGILFLSPVARYSKLTGHNFDYTFRTLLANDDTAMQVANYAAQKGYKNIAILHSRDNSSTELAEAFSTYAVDKHAANIVFRRSFFDNVVNIIDLIIDLKNVQKLDAVFIATSSGELSAKVYEQSRSMGVKQAFIGGEALDTKPFLTQVSQWENAKDIQKSAIPTLFNASSPKGQDFVKRYKNEYGLDEQPDYVSTLGYDTVVVLAHAIQLAQSTIPVEIATALRYMDPCQHIAGKYEFKPNGDLKNKALFFKHLLKHDFVYEQANNVKTSETINIPECNDIDRDHDTIPDNVDACPDSTDAEKVKGVRVQGANKGCPVDTDEDDVPDFKDSCSANTKRETAHGVDPGGCPNDSDKDGAADYVDDDIDGDTIANLTDLCPKNTTAELAYGVNLTGKQLGCPLDSDADTVPDYLDTCRTNTPEEIKLGVTDAGCPVDKDMDGVLDYQDMCLKSPQGVVMAQQGCEVMDVTTTQKPNAFFFAPRQISMTPDGIALLDGLLVNRNLALLKKVQLIGYATQKNAAVSQNQLLTIADYLQQKKIPVDQLEMTTIETDNVPLAVETAVDKTKTDANKAKSAEKAKAAAEKARAATIAANAKKNDTIEIIFSQFQPKPVAADPLVPTDSPKP